jgi:hypothetical protein
MKKGKVKCDCSHGTKGSGCMFYFLGIIGVAWYNISVATGFWVGVLGVVKALVWPVFLVYELLKFIG